MGMLWVGPIHTLGCDLIGHLAYIHVYMLDTTDLRVFQLCQSLLSLHPLLLTKKNCSTIHWPKHGACLNVFTSAHFLSM